MDGTADDRSDLALLRASGRDPAAFAVFYRRHERLVLGWLARRAASVEEAADLTAETFAAAWLAHESYREQSPCAAPWLLGIARNKLRMSARRHRVEQAASRQLGLERIAVDDATLRGVERLFGDADAWLADLPAEQRDAVRAYVIDEEHYTEIADRLDIQEPAVRKRVSRGLARLRQTLKQQGASS